MPVVMIHNSKTNKIHPDSKIHTLAKPAQNKNQHILNIAWIQLQNERCG